MSGTEPLIRVSKALETMEQKRKEDEYFAAFLRFKDACTRGNRDLLFDILEQRGILNAEEMSILAFTYEVMETTVGSARPRTTSGFLQGSKITPALRCLQARYPVGHVPPVPPLAGLCRRLRHLRREFPALIRFIELSAERNLHLNTKKSGILRLHKAIGKPRAASPPVSGISLVKEYRYLGTWLNQRLLGAAHQAKAAKKVGNLTGLIKSAAAPLPLATKLQL